MSSYSQFFNKNISIYAIFNDQSFNHTLTNDIISFEQLGPGVCGFNPSRSDNILSWRLIIKYFLRSFSLLLIQEGQLSVITITDSYQLLVLLSADAWLHPLFWGPCLLVWAFWFVIRLWTYWITAGTMTATTFWRKNMHKHWLSAWRTASPGKVWLGELTALDMTLMGWLGHKAWTQSKFFPEGWLLVSGKRICTNTG